jgi:hypothetical protein
VFEVAIALFDEETERMTGWVEEDPYLIERLVLRKPCSLGDRVAFRRDQIFYAEVEVRHLVLLVVALRPYRRPIPVFRLERETRRVRPTWMDQYEVVVPPFHIPSQQTDVEVGELMRVGTIEDDRRELDRRPLCHRRTHYVGHVGSEPCPSDPYRPPSRSWLRTATCVGLRSFSRSSSPCEKTGVGD